MNTNREKETHWWLKGVITSHSSLPPISLHWSVSTATVCPACPGEHKATRLPLVVFVTFCRQIAVHKVAISTDFIILLAGWCIYPQWSFTLQPSFSGASVEEGSDNSSHFGPLWPSPHGIWTRHLLITASKSLEVHASLSCPVQLHSVQWRKVVVPWVICTEES